MGTNNDCRHVVVVVVVVVVTLVMFLCVLRQSVEYDSFFCCWQSSKTISWEN